MKIKINRLNFWYSSKKVLQDINLEIEGKKITSLIGPSGCGKSTFLRCINRMNDLISISKLDGEIFYDDKNVRDFDSVELRKNIGMVFQKPNPFPMSIKDNVAYGLKLQGRNENIDLAVRESLKKADLWDEVKDDLEKSAFRLSGGQQQRLCIARALAISPDVLLLDEPCSSLDPIATAKIEDLLKKLKEETTMIIVTHNMAQARRISDSTIFLLDGKVIEFGSTKQVFEAPKNKLTEDYINGVYG